MRDLNDDAHRLHSTACERNREPIFEVLKTLLPEVGRVLEVASGTGMHGAYFAPRLPNVQWQPSDRGPDTLASIECWRKESGAVNLLAPIELDVLEHPWSVREVDAIFNANMIHISPLAVCKGLFKGAAAALRPGGSLILYGPFWIEGETRAPSNVAFDLSLKSRNETWGIRSLNQVREIAKAHGFEWIKRVSMPANNEIQLFELKGA